MRADAHIAIVGATGLVGRKVLDILDEQKIPFASLTLIASARSAGETISFQEKDYIVQELKDDSFKGIDYAIFSAGGSTSLKYAPVAKEVGTVVIDNSSAWRMQKGVPLAVPEVNEKEILNHQNIIANPNCSTIQMVVALKPIHDKYKIKRIVVSTYQSVTGSGKKAVEQLHDELRNGKSESPVYPHKIAFNALPHIDVFAENDYSKEELKMIYETKKILDDQSIKITSTTVRIPTHGGHSESINLELEKDFDLDEIRSLLDNSRGVTVLDKPEENIYPTALIAHEKDDVFVGRIRRDETVNYGLNLWVVSDNLRKGAATNAVQILKFLLENE